MSGVHEPKIDVIPLKGDPGVIDEIQVEKPPNVHIERMTRHEYCALIGSATFTIRTRGPQGKQRGPGIELVAVDVPGYDA